MPEVIALFSQHEMPNDNIDVIQICFIFIDSPVAR